VGLHEFTDDGTDPGNCAVCHFFHAGPRGPRGERPALIPNGTRVTLRKSGDEGTVIDQHAQQPGFVTVEFDGGTTATMPWNSLAFHGRGETL
jgi:hypothetical protein